jgi:hypothetical protein
MQSTAESNTRSALINAFRRAGAQATAIESGSTQLGIPDAHIRTLECNSWWEVKHNPNAFYNGKIYKPTYRPKQYDFLKEHARLGGISALLVNNDYVFYLFFNDAIQKEYSPDFMSTELHILTSINEAVKALSEFCELQALFK